MRIIWFTCLLFIPFWGWSNGLKLEPIDRPDSVTLVVEISWNNSWRFREDSAAGNHDAIWIFVKYQTTNGVWHHLDLNSVGTEVATPGMLATQVASDQKGAWVYRNSPGTGDISPHELQLRLAQALPSDVNAISVFGIEMVWVPEGAFWLGDGQSNFTFKDSLTGGPYRVSSEAGISPGVLTTAGNVGPGSLVPESYPKGTRGFYQMKYELGQAQYRDFLNCLSYSQQQTRTQAAPNSASGTLAMAPSPAFPGRNGIIISQPGIPGQLAARYACEANADGVYDQHDDGQTRACNFISWADLAAYLDWAALRPLTELEFEKACRGPLEPVAREFAWGTDQVIDANTLLMDGTDLESVAEQAQGSAGLASHGYLGPQGPLRNGFGANDSSDRLQAGATYFGALEMSGNLWEICVGISNEGLPFDGQAGDGLLASTGDSNELTWPGASGAIFRGGGFNSGILPTFRDLAVSDRFYHDLTPSQRRNTTGGRGGRFP